MIHLEWKLAMTKVPVKVIEMDTHSALNLVCAMGVMLEMKWEKMMAMKMVSLTVYVLVIETEYNLVIM